jgi:hypothetical protein
MVVLTATVSPQVGRVRLALDCGSAELSKSPVVGHVETEPNFALVLG